MMKNRKLDTCGREDDYKKLVKRMRVNNGDVCSGDDDADIGKSLLDQETKIGSDGEDMEIVNDGFDFLQSTVACINQETDIDVVHMTGVYQETDIVVGDIDCEVSHDVDLDGGMEFDFLESKVSRTTRCGGMTNKEECSTSGSGATNDDVVMNNTSSATTNRRCEAFDPVGLGNGFFNNTSSRSSIHEQQVSTSSSLDFSAAFMIGYHILKNKIWDVIAGKVSPSDVVAMVKMLETLLPYVAFFLSKIFQVTGFFLPSIHRDSVETYELVSEASHLKYAFLLHGVKDERNIEIRIQDNQTLVLKSIKVVAGRLVPIRKIMDLPPGNYSHATIDKNFDKESGLFTLTIKNFI